MTQGALRIYAASRVELGKFCFWGYALLWILVNDRIKLAAYRLFDPREPGLPGQVPARTGA